MGNAWKIIRSLAYSLKIVPVGKMMNSEECKKLAKSIKNLLKVELLESELLDPFTPDTVFTATYMVICRMNEKIIQKYNDYVGEDSSKNLSSEEPLFDEKKKALLKPFLKTLFNNFKLTFRDEELNYPELNSLGAIIYIITNEIWKNLSQITT